MREKLWVRKVRTLGLIIAGGVGAIIFVNGLFMLASPKAWLRLPHWIGLRGTLTEQEYSSGWRSVTVRLGGAVTLAFIGWVLYDSVVGTATGEMIGAFSWPSGAGKSVQLWACLVICIGGLTCGLIMLLLPKWWIKRYWRHTGLKETVLVRAVRVLSLPVIGVTILFLMQCLTIR